MRIFYAVQATGNGHVSRAEEIMPYLREYGDVDVFLSGENLSLKTTLPIAFKSKGVNLYYDRVNGGVDMTKTITSFRFSKILTEAKHLPLEKYDLIINDFESITSLSCLLKRLPSVHFGHQASFASKKVPRPTIKSKSSEWILNYYARGQRSVGLHFLAYDEFIFPPIIRKDVSDADPSDKGYVTVYLGHYSDFKLIPFLMQITDVRFQVFSPTCISPYTENHIEVFPVNKDLFTKSLIHCHGIITGAGFETPAEALYLRKKLLVVPMKGQYEQACNAAALERLGVPSIPGLNDNFTHIVQQWLEKDQKTELPFFSDTQSIVASVVHDYPFIDSYSINQNNTYDLHKQPTWTDHCLYREKYPV